MSVSLNDQQRRQNLDDAYARSKAGGQTSIRTFEVPLNISRNKNSVADKDRFIREFFFNTILIQDNSSDTTTDATFEISLRKDNGGEPIVIPLNTCLKLKDDVWNFFEVFNELQTDKELLVTLGMNLDINIGQTKLSAGSTVSLSEKFALQTEFENYSNEIPNATTQTQDVDTPTFVAGTVTISNANLIGFRFIKIWNSHPTQILSVARNAVSTTAPRAEIPPYSSKTFIKDDSTNTLVLTYLNDATIAGATHATVMKRV